MKKLPLSLTTKSECLDTKKIVVDVTDIVVDIMVILDTLAYATTIW